MFILLRDRDRCKFPLGSEHILLVSVSFSVSGSANEPLVWKRQLGHPILGLQLLKSMTLEEIPTSASELFLFLGLPLVTLRPPREDFVVVFTESSASISRVVSKTELLALSIREDISDSFTWNKMRRRCLVRM